MRQKSLPEQMQILRQQISESSVRHSDRESVCIVIDAQFLGHNSFIERLCETAECSEHCKMEFLVRVKDTTAPVYFLLDK